MVQWDLWGKDCVGRTAWGVVWEVLFNWELKIVFEYDRNFYRIFYFITVSIQYSYHYLLITVIIVLYNRSTTRGDFMPTNKAPCGFYIDDEYLEKMKYIAKRDTRSLSNLLEHLCKLHIEQYEDKNGEIVLPDFIKGNQKQWCSKAPEKPPWF